MSRSIEVTTSGMVSWFMKPSLSKQRWKRGGLLQDTALFLFFVHPGNTNISWVEGGAVFKEIVSMFLYIAVFSSVLSGLGNGAYYYFQMTYLHRGIQGLSKSKRIILAAFFAAATASLTMAFMVGVALLVLPFFQHQFLL